MLEERFGPRLLSLRVFGSYARGDADADSDIDVAVVVRDLTEPERTAAVDLALEAWRTDRSTGPLSPLVWSEAELADRLRAERRIASDVVSEGVVP
jgi:predicted nucleotidyltransferase